MRAAIDQREEAGFLANKKFLDHDLGPGGAEPVAELTEDDQEIVSQVVDGLLAKSRLKALAGGIA